MEKIYLILGGGLGNQMFQYAAARAYQLEFGGDLILCCFFYTDKINNGRIYALGNMALSDNVRLATEAEELYVKNIWRTRKGIRYLKIVHKMPKSIRKFISKRDMKKGYVNSLNGPYMYIPFVKSDKKEVIIVGGFQSYKYFEKYKDIIRTELHSNLDYKIENTRIIEKVKGTESVCVHIRRGDFLDPKFAHLNICNSQYYQHAMKYMINNLKNPNFFIFSNTHEDLIYIEENYNLPGTVEYVDLNNKDWQELNIMQQCKHFIVSNSTFSWWAQYLGGEKDSIVCAPFEWDKQYPDDSDIYIQNWILIK